MPGLDYLQVFSYTASLLFTLWPLMLLAPLQGAVPTRRSRAVSWGRILFAMLMVWLFLAAVRIFLIFVNLPILALFFPEPLNTIVFFVAGVILFALKFGRDLLQRRDIQKKADTATSVDDLRSLSPSEFEYMVVELYNSLGHVARRTGATGDHGVDVVVEASNGEKWIVQCKRWRGTVGEPVVRDFHGVMQHEKADKGAIITTGKFTAQAQDWARGKPITLLEGEEFLERLQRARQSSTTKTAYVATTASTASAAAPIAPPRCPKCGSIMVLRTARQGPNAGEKFWGCSTYPKCRGIVNV